MCDGENYINNALFSLPYDKFLVAILNSPVCWFHLTSESTALRGGFSQADAADIDTLPIPSCSQKLIEKVESLVDGCMDAADERYTLQQALTRRISDLASPDIEPKLTNKLKFWWEFTDFAAFRKEVKKTLKADIPLAERSEWEDWIGRDKAEIARLTAEIKTNENKINTIVYNLFKLTDDEISLLEENV